MSIRVDAQSFSAEVLEAPVPVLADFYSDSCLPCRKLAAELPKLEAAYGDRIKIVKINVKYDADLARDYQVRGTPTLVLFRQGAEAGRLSGAVSREQIAEKLEELL